MPRFMVLVSSNADLEAGVLPSAEQTAAMSKFNEELVKAGVRVDAQGLKPTSAGARLRYEGSKRTVIDGPFTEAKELIAGYWILQSTSREEVIELLKKAPFDGGAELEIREIFEMEDRSTPPGPAS